MTSVHRVVRSGRVSRVQLTVLTVGVALALLCPAGAVAQTMPFQRGDANADGTVDVSDCVSILLFLYAGRELSCLDAADADDSGNVDVTDVVYTSEFLFVDGSSMPAPGDLVCGPDPTPDALTCNSSPRCTEADTLTVGPEGGRLEFASGVVLDIPPGAASEATTITLSPLPELDALLNSRSFASSDKRSLGGFVADVDGPPLQGRVLGSIPVLPLEPGGFPHLAEVDLEAGEYWLIPGDLTYSPDEGRIEADLEHFFGGADGAGGQGGAGSPSALIGTQLSGIPSDDPCRSKEIHVQSSSKSYRNAGPNTDCGIVSDQVEVTFPDCPGAPTETVHISEIASQNPSACRFTVQVVREHSVIDVGGTIQLNGTVRNEADGRTFETFFLWSSSDPGIATVDAFTGLVRGVAPGKVEITARTGAAHVKGSATVEVRGYKVTVQPINSLGVGHEKFLEAVVEDHLGQVVEDVPVYWETPSDVILLDRESGLVVGVAVGSAVVEACTEDAAFCDEEWFDVLDLSVAIVPVDPIEVGENVKLEAVVVDHLGQVIEGLTLSWETQSDVVLLDAETGWVIGVEPGLAEVVVCVDETSFCSPPVGVCVMAPLDSIGIRPPSVLMDVGDILPVRAEPLDSGGNAIGCDADFDFHWLSTNVDVVSVRPPGTGSTVRLEATGAGTATIQAEHQGFVGIATVTVVPAPVFYAEVEPQEAEIRVAEGLQLTAVARGIEDGEVLLRLDPWVKASKPGCPTDTLVGIPYSDPELAFTLIQWLSDDPSIATVDRYGKVHGVSAGTVEITATILPEPSFHDIPSESASATIHVRGAPLISARETVQLTNTLGISDVSFCYNGVSLGGFYLAHVSYNRFTGILTLFNFQQPIFATVRQGGHGLGTDPSRYGYTYMSGVESVSVQSGDSIVLWDGELRRYLEVLLGPARCAPTGGCASCEVLALSAEWYQYRDWIDLPTGWYFDGVRALRGRAPWDFAPVPGWEESVESLWDVGPVCETDPGEPDPVELADFVLRACGGDPVGTQWECIGLTVCGLVCDNEDCMTLCRLNVASFLEPCEVALLNLVRCAAAHGCSSIDSDCAREHCLEEWCGAF